MAQNKLLNLLEDAHSELEGNGDIENKEMPAGEDFDGLSRADVFDFINFANRQGKRLLETFHDVLIVNHFDCDGLASGAICGLALKDRGIPFRLLTVKKMDETVIEKVALDPSNHVIFIDIGTGFLNQINQIAKSGKSIIQIDHHTPEKIIGKSDAFEIINCHNFGIDGSFYLCSSSAAYFVFAQNCSVNFAKRIMQLGIVGTIGDMQDARGLVGLNKIMLNEARQLKVVDVIKDLRLFGRVSRSLISFLTYCTEPFLPSLSGNSKNCALFLKKNGIPLFEEKEGRRIWLRYYDLPKDTRIRLIGALLNFCFEKKISEDSIKQMIGDVYLFPHENHSLELYDGHEFSSILNACGRNGSAEIGISLCMGDPTAYENAHALLLKNRMEISKGIAFARKSGEDMGAFYFLDARGEISDSIIGTVAGSYYNSGTFQRTKPIIAISIDENANIKASSRAWKGLSEKGLDLGQVMNKACAQVGGFGGGHSVAAGASFKNDGETLSKFLIACKKEIKLQIGI
ncbi:DHH family phosphoesterase [Candidatus Micrarchaeota archaeon]|nr:DHH family phosphoesterase [Candidatus Micrarchaeota archaeon]